MGIGTDAVVKDTTLADKYLSMRDAYLKVGDQLTSVEKLLEDVKAEMKRGWGY